MRVQFNDYHRLERRKLTSISCVVAGRLANLDHNLQVMLVEAGENNLNNPWVRYFYYFAGCCRTSTYG